MAIPVVRPLFWHQPDDEQNIYNHSGDGYLLAPGCNHAVYLLLPARSLDCRSFRFDRSGLRIIPLLDTPLLLNGL